MEPDATLTPCPKCGQPCADDAFTCPSCGARLRRVVFKSKLITPDFGAIGEQSGELGRTMLVLLIGILLVIGALFLSRNSDDTGTKVERSRPAGGFP